MENETIHTQLDDLMNSLNDLKEIPPWAAILIKSTQAILTEIKCLNDLAVRVNKLDDFKAVNEQVTTRLVEENRSLRERIDILEAKSDDQEQRNRAYCLLIHGCPESDDENTDDVALDVFNIQEGLLDIRKTDFIRTHRTGPKPKVSRNTRSSGTAQRPRPIIVRFSNWNARKKVFSNKRELRGKQWVITESLTKYRLELFKKAQAKYGRNKVWTNEGYITTILNDKYVTITSEMDL